MDNQLPTQQILNNRDAVMKKVKDNLNYIYITLMVIANCLISLLKVEDGKIGLKYPKDGLSWVLWITQVLAITAIGVMILGAFRRQGIKNGHKIIKGVYDDYLDAIQAQIKAVNPRSLKQYMAGRTLKDSVTKGSGLIIINLLVLSVSISANINSLLSLIVNIIFSVSFGLKAMLEAEDYVVTELVIWYKIKIKEIKEDGYKKSRSRSSKSSRIQ